MDAQVRLEGLARLGAGPLFAVDGVAYGWRHVLERADLVALRATARRGVACLRRAEALSDEPDDGTVQSAAARFRYGRGLLSADELELWLERWGLTVGEWGGYLVRSLLLERWAGKLEAIEAEFGGDGRAVEEAEFVDGVCSGLLEREAHALAADAALAGGSPNLQQLVEAAAAARAAAASPAAVEREIAGRRLDWTRLDVDLLELPDRDTAAEAALCVRIDRRELADVAQDCETVAERTSIYLGDSDAGFAASLLAAQPGELVGPLERSGSFVLVAVRERVPPSSSDPELRRRAEALLVDRAVERAVESRVEWFEVV
jgi:hypothetical protein